MLDLDADESVWRRSIGLLPIKIWHPIRQIHFIFINRFVGQSVYGIFQNNCRNVRDEKVEFGLWKFSRKGAKRFS